MALATTVKKKREEPLRNDSCMKSEPLPINIPSYARYCNTARTVYLYGVTCVHFARKAAEHSIDQGTTPGPKFPGTVSAFPIWF